MTTGEIILEIVKMLCVTLVILCFLKPSKK